MNGYRAALEVYVVWHPEFKRGEEVANRLYLHFAQDGSLPGIRRGVGVPVFFRSAPAGVVGTEPAPIDLTQADHSVVVPLVDRQMFEAAGQGWERYFAALLPQLSDEGPHRLFPVAFNRAAGSWRNAFGQTQALSLRPEIPRKTEAQKAEEADSPEKQSKAAEELQESEARQNTNVLHDVTHELARLLLNQPRTAQASTHVRLSKAPVTLFLSHAKRDGEEMAKEIDRYIGEHMALKTFFDKTSIAVGSDFAAELIGNVDGAAVLVLLTDSYASRPWCQREVLRAKQLGQPVLVVDALKLGEARSFPYLGNTPTVRWQDGPAGFDAPIGYLLREVLRTEHFKRYVESLKTFAGLDAAAHALPYPPELVTAVERRKNGPHAPLYVYPDPPISAAEEELLASMDPTLRWSTPTLLLCNPQTSGNETPLCNLRVGLSISESPDLAALGFGQPHLNDAFAEIARHLLAAGATLGTGHDLRLGGFGEALIQLAQAYFSDFEKKTVPIHSYLGWSAKPTLSEERRDDLVQLVRFHFGPAPQEPEPPAGTKEAPNPEHACWRARGFTAMREQMNADLQARVLLGGKIEGVTGPWPGVVEEAWLALKERKAVFLLGAFGGATRDVIGTLRGEKVPRMTKEWNLASQDRKPIVEAWDRWAPAHGLPPVSYAPPVPVNAGEWWKVLNNGLDQAENERLAETVHIPEMVALVLRGLGRLASGASSCP
ncbi:MAG: TIR domain-containing protein [Chthoniobacteraceae bacterium]